jgi:hypothetical protein
MPKLIEGGAPISEPSRFVPVEARKNVTEEPKVEKTELSPPCATELPKPSNIPAATPRKRRMAIVLYAVMESMKTSTPASAEEAKVSKKSEETGMAQTISESRPSEVPAEARPSESAPIILEKEGAFEKSKSPSPRAPAKELEFIVQHALGKQFSEEQIAEAQHYAKDLKYPRGSLVYGGDDEDDFLYCLPDNKEIKVCREMVDNIGYPKLELGLSAMSKDQIADSLAYNSLKVCMFWFGNISMAFLILISCSFVIFQGLILSKDLKAQKDAEDESCKIALGNLRSEVISLRNEALEKDRILLSLVEKLKSSEASLAAQAEAHKAEVEELKKKVVEASENFEIEAVKHEICEIERSRAQRNCDELHASKEKCYEISLECAKRLKDNFARVGAYSSEQKFIRGDPDGDVQWISREVEAFDEILSVRGDFCAFAGARGHVDLRESWLRTC